MPKTVSTSSRRITFPHQVRRIKVVTLNDLNNYTRVRAQAVSRWRELSDAGFQRFSRKLSLFERKNGKLIGFIHDPSGKITNHNYEHLRELDFWHKNGIALNSHSMLAYVSEGAFDSIQHPEAGKKRDFSGLFSDIKANNAFSNGEDVYHFTRSALKHLGSPAKIRLRIARLLRDSAVKPILEELNGINVAKDQQYHFTTLPKPTQERAKKLIEMLLEYIREHSQN